MKFESEWRAQTTFEVESYHSQVELSLTQTFSIAHSTTSQHITAHKWSFCSFMRISKVFDVNPFPTLQFNSQLPFLIVLSPEKVFVLAKLLCIFNDALSYALWCKLHRKLEQNKLVILMFLCEKVHGLDEVRLERRNGEYAAPIFRINGESSR